MPTVEAEAKALVRRRAEDRQLDRDLLLLHIAVSHPYDAAELSRRITRPKAAVHEDLKTLIAQGDVHFHDGALRVSAAARIIAAASSEQLRVVHDQVLAEIEAGHETRPVTLIALAESGCRDDTLLRGLVRVIGERPEDAAALAALASVARARGLSDEDKRLLMATDAAIRGRADDVLAHTDAILASGSPETSGRAAALAAGAHIQSNRLERALALYRRADAVQPTRPGRVAAWAAVAAVGVGDLDAARAWRAKLSDDTLTNHDAGLLELVDGLLASVTQNGDGALEHLARSVSTLAPLGTEILLPESPAALAAFVSIGRGDPATAEIILDRALNSQLGNTAARQRHLLLNSWSRMVQGKMTAAEVSLAAVAVPEHLCDRDRLLYWSLRAGLARRRTDLAGMREAWNQLRAHVFGLSLTLFDLLPLGEIVVVATRFRDTERVRALTTRAQTLTAQLGEPPVWSAPFHWSGVLAAFQGNDPAAMIPHATALAKARATSSYAETLAQAGQTWLEVLRGEANFESVETSARALSEHGQVWDAARLAGQAALQHPEREGALSLMQLAREINKETAHSSQPTRNRAALTAREMEVAQLVVEGQGYRAIGEQLFISPKTVEHHVARIRNRLGASSRGELLDKLHNIVAESTA